MYRTPTDRPGFAQYFYNTDYKQGSTTQIPSDHELSALLQSCFAGEKSFDRHIHLLQSAGVGPGARIFDFGCSWGYGSYQFSAAGYDVFGYEVARERARFAAERLGVSIMPTMDSALSDLAKSVDVFFSAHVLEHVSSIRNVVDQAFTLLRPGGLFISVTPNGCAEHRAVNPQWSQLWGEVHPNFIDAEFLVAAVPGAPRYVGCLPLPPKLECGFVRGRLDGDELAFIAQKP